MAGPFETSLIQTNKKLKALGFFIWLRGQILYCAFIEQGIEQGRNLFFLLQVTVLKEVHVG